ncbi:protein BIG GRAIN 1-like A [Senna tora]|uniref:Protein BIG GRAIN 1-like A n=1 Tax=Senna tora TaxID=362788 RepID=A0A834WBN8_9FABA|nr:protein BIG GRAIN 1-like A [Senna tora]
MYMTRTQPTFPTHPKIPSFSSTLLDNIYRSIEESEREMKFGRCSISMEEEDRRDVAKANLGRACLIEKWMDKKANEKVDLHDQDAVFLSSTSTSSDSSTSCGGLSDTDSIYWARSQSSSFTSPRPKPKPDGVVGLGMMRSKCRAPKIYENLKETKQPISPGRRLSNFLNSLFTNTKKSKSICSVGGCEDVRPHHTKSKTAQASTSSSFSRSCLTKTKHSTKTTVRFYPLNVIVDEKQVPVMDNSRRVQEAARDFFKERRQNHKKTDFFLRDFPIRIDEIVDDDDAASYSSSDLFELDHLAFMGNDRYSEELPVYETTHVSAIANGLIILVVVNFRSYGDSRMYHNLNLESSHFTYRNKIDVCSVFCDCEVSTVRD